MTAFRPTAEFSLEFPADLTPLNTMALHSRAKAHLRLASMEDVIPTFAKLQRCPARFVILSGGSNVILPPLLDATVISPTFLGKTLLNENDDSVTLAVMAGENWHDFVQDCTAQGWFGLENLALIPGWVGSCPVQNIGAYGVQVEDAIVSVTALHIPTLTWQTLSKADCNFGYRDSIFKQQAGDWLITRVVFQLSKIPSLKMQYGDVATVAMDFAKKLGKSQPDPSDVMHAIIHIRAAKLPDPNVLPNCGSFFKNPLVAAPHVTKLLQDFPQLVHYPTKDSHKVKVAAGWLIEQAGLKGKGIAPIFTHDKQALVLTNHAANYPNLQATQADVANAVQFIQAGVYAKFGISLEPEPVWIT